jgi:hypothetical protein
MRRCPATSTLVCVSVLSRPLTRANYRRLMSVNFGSVRDGSSAQESLPGEVTAEHILHMKFELKVRDPGLESGHAHPFQE